MSLDGPRITTSGEASMLPGFRFLIATLLLTASVVIFGLGAAALLRATRDDLAARPSTWDAPEAVVARERDTRKATLALLRLETIADQDSNVEKLAALAAVAPSAAETAEGGAPVATEAMPGPAVEADRGAAASDPVAAKAADGATLTVAAVEPSASSGTSPADRADAVPQPAKSDLTVTALADPAAASAEVATRPAVEEVAKPVAKSAAASASKVRAEAAKREKARQEAAQRRRIALRARTLSRPPQPQRTQPGNPFAGFGG